METFTPAGPCKVQALSYRAWRLTRAYGRGTALSPDAPSVIVTQPPTFGVWSDRTLAEEVRRRWLPPTASRMPTLFVLDLNMVSPSPDVLEELLVQAGQEVKAGGHGLAALAVSTGNASLRRIIEALATRESLPLYLSTSAELSRIAEAEPAGEFTASERETLEAVVAMGGRVSATDLAKRLELNPTAASNRLVNLVAKGYLLRQSRPGREGDLFVDPRFASPEQNADAIIAAAREALDPDDFRETEQLIRRSIRSTAR